MHIGERVTYGLQRGLHGLAEHMLGPETLSHEAVKQTLEPARMALGAAPVVLGLVRPRSTLSGWCPASCRSRSTSWPPCKAVRLWRTAVRGSG